MLFRKLQLDWRYSVSELFIVVAGVMIALAADGWIQDRSDGALELQYLDGLATDLHSDTAELSSTIDLAAGRARLGHNVLAAMTGDAVLSPIDLAALVERVMYFTYPAYSRSTMAELTSTGNLRLLRDQQLKRRLAEYYQEIDRMEQWSGNWRRIQMDLEHFLPELLQLSHREALISTGAPTEGMGSYSPADAVRIPWAPELHVTEAEAQQILARLRARPEVRARIEGMVRVQDSQYSYLIQLRSRATAALRAVENVAN